MVSDAEEKRWVYGDVPGAASLGELERRADRLPSVWLLEMGELAAIVGDVPENDAKGVRNQALAMVNAAYPRALTLTIADFIRRSLQ